MSQKYKLLTKCIVAALHPNEPQKKGVVWEPGTDDAVAEAEALANVGYAQKTNEAVTDPTFARVAVQTPEESVAAAAANSVSDDDKAEMEEYLLGTVDEVVGGLGEYTVEGLDALAALEAAGKNRKGVIEGIATAREAAVAEAGDK